MSKWKTVRLGDVCEKGSSNIAQNEITENNGEYPIFGAAGFIKNIDFYKYDKPYIGIVKDGAGIGRVSVHPAKSSLIGTMQYIFPKENIDINFLAEFLKYQDLSRFHTGATIPHIYFKDYQNISMKLPPLKTQKQIASTLDKCTSVIEKYKKMLEKYDTLIKSRFIEMFGDPSKNTKKWEIKKLGSIIRVLGGYAFSSKSFKALGIPVLRIGNINSGIFRPSNMVFWDDDEKIERYAIYPGDLVMSLTGTVGKDDYGNVCILSNDYPKYYLNQRNAKLEIISGLERFYLSYLLRVPEIKSRLTNISRGIRQANIANKDIENLQIPVPPLELQNTFASFVQQIDKSKFVVQKSLEKAETLYKSLMQEYFE